MRLVVLMAHSSPWSLDIAGSLQAGSHEVHVVDFEAPAESEIPTDSRDTAAALGAFASVTLVPKPRGGLAQIFALVRALRAHARRARPDAVLCLYGGRFACAAWLSGVRPYAVWVVGSDVLLANKPLRLINRFSLGSAARVFANGAHLAERAKSQAPSATVENLLIGVDSQQFVPGTRTGPARLFNHRWFAPVYDNQTIIRALALLPPDVPPFHMTFASGGPDLAAAKALATEVLPPRLRDTVRFLDGKLRRQELLDELARSDIFLSMSLSDGTATSVLEAMMSGVYPVLSDIAANRALVDADGGIGSLVPVGNPAALAAELTRCIVGVDSARADAPAIRAHVLRFAASSATRATLAARLMDIAQSTEYSRRVA